MEQHEEAGVRDRMMFQHLRNVIRRKVNRNAIHFFYIQFLKSTVYVFHSLLLFQ
jgi:hypothetical protein